MKSLGIIRRIDDLGRIVIPKEIRKSLYIKEGDPLEIFLDENEVICFKRYNHPRLSTELCGKISKYYNGIKFIVLDNDLTTVFNNFKMSSYDDYQEIIDAIIFLKSEIDSSKNGLTTDIFKVKNKNLFIKRLIVKSDSEETKIGYCICEIGSSQLIDPIIRLIEVMVED